MFKRYSEKQVRELVERLREEYGKALKVQTEAKEELREENRMLRARLSVLEGQRGEVSAALMRAVAEGERIKKESSEETESERRELVLLADKCRLLADRLLAKYPDEEDCKDFKLFTDSLRTHLGENDGEDDGFHIEDVLDPKEPLDLEKLCRDLGLMEEEG